jgi:hypothetical protein
LTPSATLITPLSIDWIAAHRAGSSAGEHSQIDRRAQCKGFEMAQEWARVKDSREENFKIL